MKDWLAANLFFLGMILAAWGLWYLGVRAVRSFPLAPSVEQALIAFVSVACIVGAGVIGRQVLRAFGGPRAR
jgi:hypothetical protein